MVDFGEGNGTPLQYSCLENPMDGGAWWAAVHRVAKSWTQLSDFTFTFHFHALEKEMAAHSSVLAWRIPGMEEPGGLPSMELHRVRHNWSNLAAAAVVDLQCCVNFCSPWWTYFQDRNRGPDAENRQVDTGGKERAGQTETPALTHTWAN